MLKSIKLHHSQTRHHCSEIGIRHERISACMTLTVVAAIGCLDILLRERVEDFYPRMKCSTSCLSTEEKQIPCSLS